MRKIKYTVALTVLLSLGSCSVEPAVEINREDDSGKREYLFSASPSSPSTRSLYSSSEEDTVRDAVIAIYTEDGTLLRITSTNQGVDLNNDSKYSFYVLTGDLTNETIPSSENALVSLRHRYGMDNFSSYHDRWKSIPMAAKVVGKTPRELDILDGKEDGKVRFDAERLFAKLSLSIQYDTYIKNYFKVSINSVRVVNMANSVSPFTPSLYYPDDMQFLFDHRYLYPTQQIS